MKLSQLGEFGLIDRIRRRAPQGRGVRLGIGDDAAWLVSPAPSLLSTADLLLEGVHFNLKWTSLSDLGYKALAVNLSDIAAMGGAPAYAVVSLGIPTRFQTEDIDKFYAGMNRLARSCHVSLVGGDTCAAKSLLISVSLLGYASHRPIARRGAKIGDDIYVTGTLGDAALALQLLKRKSSALRHPAAAFLLKRHHRPTARWRTGLLLARQKLAAAMIDISDGLLQDLGHICDASGIGAILWETNLPLSRAYHMLAGKAGSRWALCGGEDYELLFCARRARRMAIQTLARRARVRITRIGCCVAKQQGVTVFDPIGNRLRQSMRGHDHFGEPGLVRLK
jgi:thiamine-monophosphate kinase